jgi:hypothetical protein
MPTRTEDVLDEKGKLVAVNVIRVDQLGRPVVQNVPASVAQGVSLEAVVAVVAAEVKGAVMAKIAGPSAMPLNQSQVKSVAVKAGAKK